MPVVFLCIFIFVIKQKQVIIFICGNVFPVVLLGHECGSGDNDAIILESNLYGSEVPYCWDFDVLDDAIGLDRHIPFKVVCVEKDTMF